MNYKHFSLVAVFATVVSLSWAWPPIAGQWTFEGNLDAKVGAAMEYRGDTQIDTTFAKTSALGLPTFYGVDRVVMSYPACTASQGFIFTPNTSASGGNDTNQYSLLWDVCYKTIPSGYAAFYQTDPNNNNDAELFSNSGALGIQSVYDGALEANKWNRVVITMNNRNLRKFINGTLVGAQTLDGYADDNFSFYSKTSPNGDKAILFCDNDGETAAGYCAQFVIYDGVLTDEEVAQLTSGLASVDDWSLM